MPRYASNNDRWIISEEYSPFFWVAVLVNLAKLWGGYLNDPVN